MRMAGWVLVLITACGGGGAEDAGDGELDGGRDGGDANVPRDAQISIDVGESWPDVPECHWDCFFGRECIDGQVIEVWHAPVDCDDWTGRCPTFVAGECSEGCSDRAPEAHGRPRDGTWTAWCEEGELARIDDACTVDEDCEPPAPDYLGGADYMACVDGACAAAEAPPLPTDIEAPCTIDVEAAATGGTQLVADDGCESGWCELARDVAAGCVRHACAAPCAGDWDCPEATRCWIDDPTRAGSCVRRPLNCH